MRAVQQQKVAPLLAPALSAVGTSISGSRMPPSAKPCASRAITGTSPVVNSSFGALGGASYGSSVHSAGRGMAQ